MLITFVAAAVINQQISSLNTQDTHARNIQTGAADLNYLSNNFFLYQEDTQLFDWKTKVSSISNDISKLNSTNPQQESLVNKIEIDLENTNLGLSNLVTFLRTAPRNESVRIMPEFQRDWNQTSQNYQSLALDSSLLINIIKDQANQLNLIETLLSLVVIGLFGAYFAANYLLTYRHTLKSILGLRNGTVIIGSGNLDYQIKTNRKDEIGELAVAFNQMTSNLKTVTASKTELAKEIEERKNVEQSLRESQEKYETTFESSMDALMLLDEKGFFDCNTATLSLFGFKSVLEFTKNHPADLSPPTQPGGFPSLEAAMDHINRAFETGMDNFFWVHKRTDGTTFPADVLLTRMPLEERNVLQATVRDITERTNAEEILKRAEEKQRTLLNSANVLIQSVNAQGEFVYVNNEWKKILGYSDLDLKDLGLMNVVRKDQLEHCMIIFDKVMKGESIQDVETVFVSKNGQEIAVSGNACPIFKDGKFVSTVAFFADVTERKKSEEKLKENHIRIESMNEKLRVVGGLTRHDIRNKLASLNGYVYLLKKHADQADIVKKLDSIEKASDEIVKILDFARTYEQLGVEELCYVDVEQALDEAVALFPELNLKVVDKCHGLAVLADSFLRQLFYNFVDNTRKYGKKTSEIIVFYEQAESGELNLIYQDDGVGISSEDKLNLFKEGFSTGGSTGFGLFLIKKMVDVYGWKIQEIGDPGKGAKFVLTIPAVNSNRKESYQITS
jgi:PAS domain S-box-containing protein